MKKSKILLGKAGILKEEEVEEVSIILIHTIYVNQL